MVRPGTAVVGVWRARATARFPTIGRVLTDTFLPSADRFPAIARLATTGRPPTDGFLPTGASSPTLDRLPTDAFFVPSAAPLATTTRLLAGDRVRPTERVLTTPSTGRRVPVALVVAERVPDERPVVDRVRRGGSAWSLTLRLPNHGPAVDPTDPCPDAGVVDAVVDDFDTFT